MKYILNISIYLSLHAMISMWSVFYTYTDKSVNFVNLDQLQWVNFAACTQRPVMITGEVSHGSPFIKPI